MIGHVYNDSEGDISDSDDWEDSGIISYTLGKS